jgi:hypothetical protein
VVEPVVVIHWPDAETMADYYHKISSKHLKNFEKKKILSQVDRLEALMAAKAEVNALGEALDQALANRDAPNPAATSGEANRMATEGRIQVLKDRLMMAEFNLSSWTISAKKAPAITPPTEADTQA